MKIISLNCNNCGAPLDVPVRARFVTCGFCSCRLEVQHTGNTCSTAVMEQLVEQTNRIQDDVNDLKRKAAIEELDDAWANQKCQFVIRDEHGRESVPTGLGTFVRLCLSLFFTVVAAMSLGLLALPIGLFFGVSGIEA